MNETHHREEVEHGRAWWVWVMIGIGVLGTLALLGAAYVSFTGASAEKERDESEQEKAAIAAPANESASKILELCKKDNRVAKVLHREGVCGTSAQVRKEIQIQVLEGPEGPQGAEGPRGKQGPGPTEAQVLLAVQQHCAAQPGGSCEGPGPTRAEVRAAVAAFCADGRCRGAAGEDGEDAPPPTREQIRAVVDQYCAEQPGGSCKGPKGEDGADGADGKDGADGADGKDGADGADGKDGADGEPPVSWTWTDEGNTETDEDDTTYTCYRGQEHGGSFEKSNPKYHCHSEEDDPHKQNTG